MEIIDRFEKAGIDPTKYGVLWFQKDEGIGSQYTVIRDGWRVKQTETREKESKDENAVQLRKVHFKQGRALTKSARAIRKLRRVAY